MVVRIIINVQFFAAISQIVVKIVAVPMVVSAINEPFLIQEKIDPTTFYIFHTKPSQTRGVDSVKNSPAEAKVAEGPALEARPRAFGHA